MQILFCDISRRQKNDGTAKGHLPKDQSLEIVKQFASFFLKKSLSLVGSPLYAMVTRTYNFGKKNRNEYRYCD